MNTLDKVEWGINIAGLSFGLTDVYNALNIILISITIASMIIKVIVYAIGKIKKKKESEIKEDIGIVDDITDKVTDVVETIKDKVEEKEDGELQDNK